MKVLILQNDAKEDMGYITSIQMDCFQWDIKVLISWSTDESAKYIQIFKQYENKGTGLLEENKKNKTHEDLAIDTMTSVKSITKKDAQNLLKTYGSIAKIIQVKDYKDFLQIDGIGKTKVDCLTQAFRGKLHYV